MIGDLNFMIKSLSGAPESKYKAALRNILLMNIMSNSYESTEDPNKMTRYQMNWKKGLQRPLLPHLGNRPAGRSFA